MEEFAVESFSEKPSLLTLNSLKKADLLAIAQHYKLSPITSSQKKGEIKKLIKEYLIDEELVPEDEELSLPSTGLLELKRLEFQEREKERETQLRMKELEIREKELSVQLRLKELEKTKEPITPIGHEATTFDVSKHIRFVPPFQEKEVDKYFLHFEKIATSLEWPRGVWMLLLQSVLVGKAREVYSAMSLEHSSQYDLVKKAVLKAYELVPEAYRQNFRNYKKVDKQTYAEFAREKEALLDRWCASKEVAKDFEKLRQLVLIEEFKACVPTNVKTYIDEQKATTLHQAAVLADDYSLTHKSTFSKSDTEHSGGRTNSSGRQPPMQGPRFRYGNSDRHHSEGPRPPRSSVPVCLYCKRKGHIIAECWELEKKKTKANPVSMICTKSQNPAPVKQIIEPTKDEEKNPFISEGYISLNEGGQAVPIRILRDTGATQSLLVEGILPLSGATATGTHVLIQGVELGIVSVPMHMIYLKSDLVSGAVVVGLRPTLPIEGVSLILGNDLAGEKVIPDLQVVTEQEVMKKADGDTEATSHIFPSCAVTRAMTREMKKTESEDLLMNLADTFMSHCGGEDVIESSSHLQSSEDQETGHVVSERDKLIEEQMKDPEIVRLAQEAVDNDELEVTPEGYFKQSGVLMRKWRPRDVPATDTWRTVYQIVVPQSKRQDVLSMAHETALAGHLGINKTYQRVLNHFYWPKLRRDVVEFCNSCHVCQLVGKPNQKIQRAPLVPIPAFEEPFSRVIIDCVGPLPKTRSGNKYLLTIMCASTRFPEAVPLRNIKAPLIIKSLIKFFTLVGLPRCIQSDQGSNFMSGLMQQIMFQLGIKQLKSTAYHPESQGALERFHQTLKNMLRAYCANNDKDWDEGVHLVLFAAREAVQESLGFSPFQLVFGHTVRGPLKVLKEVWLQDEPLMNLLDYVSNMREKLREAWDVARRNLKQAQRKMKIWHDKKARDRQFKVGDKVLALLPIPYQPLQARYSGPYAITQKVSEVDYVIDTPDRRKSRRMCHVNMLKSYQQRSEETPDTTNHPEIPSQVLCSSVLKDNSSSTSAELVVGGSPRLKNSDILKKFQAGKLSHLEAVKQEEIMQLVFQFVNLFPDTPSRTDQVVHDVDVGETTPIKQHPYRVNPLKLKIIREEVAYMLDNDLIEISNSEWSSPCVLVPKPDGTYRFCTDFRRVNKVTKSDSYPIPRVDDCIDRIGNARYVTKFDLLKGYWQVPLTSRAKEVSAFVTPDGLYQYKVMPFGMKNAPATFQRLINEVLAGLDGCEAYIDDVVVYSNTWEQHLLQIRSLMYKLTEAKLTVNLVKSEFGHAHLIFLGHVVGQGQIKPVDAKVEAVVNFPVPTSKKELMRFLGMTGYYRKFCRNFSSVAAPLTDLLRKDQAYVWDDNCDKAFTKIKALLLTAPVLVTPDYYKPFKLQVDASDQGVGAVLLQEGSQKVDHPISYFSQKFNKHQRGYSTYEKETLALILALQHFEFYVSSAMYPIEIFTDHNPLVFLGKMRNKNQRLLRWSLQLQEYNLTIAHIRGRDNVIADALSRVHHQDSS